jgi:hypothetical protein
MYTVWSKDVMRMRVIKPESFRSRLSNFKLEDNSYSIFGSLGWIGPSDDDLVGGALMWIERTLEAISDITMVEMIEVFLKRALNVRYLPEDLLSDTATSFYANFKYLDNAVAWQTPADGTAALLVGSYTIFAGIMDSLGIVEI